MDGFKMNVDIVQTDLFVKWYYLKNVFVINYTKNHDFSWFRVDGPPEIAFFYKFLEWKIALIEPRCLQEHCGDDSSLCIYE